MKDANGGKATEENGAILRNLNHQWLNRQSKERQAEMNEMFQEYKRTYNGTRKIRIAQVTTEEITPVAELELPEIEEDCIEIDLEPMTEEDIRKYEEYKRKRNEKVFDKFGYKIEKPKFMTEKQRRQQRELQEDLLLEIRY